MLYSGKSYGPGDYVTICFYPGRNGTLIAREDSGRIIILERTTDMVVNPRDKVDCIVLHIKGAIEEDWTGRTRSGFTIVRAIKVKEPYVEPVKAPTGHLPQSVFDEQDMRDGTLRGPRAALPPVALPTAPAPKQEQHMLKPTAIERHLPPPLSVPLDADVAPKAEHNLYGYPRIIRFNGVLTIYGQYGQVRVPAHSLTEPQQQVMMALKNQTVLVALIDPKTHGQIVTPYQARVRAGYVVLPKAFLPAAARYDRSTIEVQFYKLP